MATAGYDGSTIPSVGPLTVDQRRRLEAVTFARKLLMPLRYGSPVPALSQMLELADYINSGKLKDD